MTEAVLDLSEEPVRIRVQYDRLLLRRNGKEEKVVPLKDIAVLIATNPQITYTNAVLSGIAETGGVFITCDRNHRPAGMLLPLSGHFIQAERFAKQAAAKKPVCKRLWQQIVSAKVRMQAKILRNLYNSDTGLESLIPRVKSGDPQNIEAQAARRYWPALFQDKDFRRDPDRSDQNRYLNYGYAVLRAITARAICAAGLHPSLGIHHHNRYNAFCLADDLMEPLRPLVDHAAVKMVQRIGPDAPMDSGTKEVLLNWLLWRYKINGEMRTLFDAMSRTASSLAAVFTGEGKDLVLPEIDIGRKKA